MRRASKYYQLKFVVECKWPNNPFYEVIAAFDNFPVAKDYAEKCGKAKSGNSGWRYRVMERKGRGQFVERYAYSIA